MGWRPILLLQKLNEINDGEYLVYLDTGCKFYGKKRFYEYIDMLKESHYLSYKLVLVISKENVWTYRNIRTNVPINGEFVILVNI